MSVFATTLLALLAILLTCSPQAAVNGRRTLRENAGWVSPVPGSFWSHWYTALVPTAPRYSRNYEPRAQGHYGFINSEIKTRFARFDNGIYELRVSNGWKTLVVYIGSAYRKGPGTLQARILEYCRDGSHKDALINRALRRGYALSVRVQDIRGSRRHVWNSENKYLAKYDYAWNQRNNGRIRGNVP